MAKKKKINRSLVVFLALAAVAVVLVGAIFWIKRGSASPDAERQAEVKAQAGEYEDADKLFDEARKYNNQTGLNKADTHVKQVKNLQEWVKSPKLSSPSQRDEKNRKVNELLREAIRIDPGSVPARELIVQRYWGYVTGMGFGNPDSPVSEYVKQAQELLKLKKDDDVTWFRLATVYGELSKSLKGDNYDKANAAFAEAIKLKPDNASYWISLAAFQMTSDRSTNRAEKTLKDAIAKNPTNAPLHIALGGLYVDKGADFSANVIEQYELAKKLDPKSAQGALALAGRYRQLKENDKAAAALRDAQKIDPFDSQTYLSLADMQRPKFADCIKVIREGLAVMSAPATGPARDDQTQGKISYGKAILTRMLGQYLLDQCETSTDAKQREALVKEARECLDKIGQLGPVETDRLLGCILFVEGKWDKAVEPLERAFDAGGKTDSIVASRLIAIYVAQQASGKAEAIIERFLKMPNGDTNPALHRALAQIKMGYGSYDEALAHVDTAVRLSPGDATLIELRNTIYAMKNQAIPSATVLTPQTARMLLGRVQSLYLQDRKVEAIRLAEQIYQKLPDDMDVIMTLARIYVSEHQDERAGILITKALKKEPDNKLLQQQLKLLNEPNLNKRFEMQIAACDVQTDPFYRALEKARVCQSYDRFEDMMKNLAEAAKLKPEDPQVIDNQFKFAAILPAKDKRDLTLAKECIARAMKAENKDFGRLLEAHLALITNTGAPSKDTLDTLQEIVRKNALDKPHEEQARFLLADCYLRTNEAAKAEEQLTAIVSVNPGNAQAVRALSLVTERLGKLSDHYRYVEQGYSLLPNDEYLKREHLRVGIEQLSPTEAVKQFEDFVAKSPKDIFARIRLAALYDRADMVERAENAYMQANALIQQDAGFTEKLTGPALLLNFYLKHEPQSPKIDRILNDLVNSSRDFKDKVGIYLLIGETRLKQETPEAIEMARAAYKLAVETDPQSSMAHQGMANFLAATGHGPEALEEMRLAYKLAPTPATQMRLAQFLIDANLFDEANGQLEAILKADSGDTTALSYQATILIRQGKYDEALAKLDQAAKANSNVVEPLLSRASLLIILGKADRAREDLEAAMKLKPALSDQRTIATFYRRLNDDAKAESIYRGILKSQPDYRLVIQDLADLYLSQKQYENLDSLLNQAIAKFPQAVQLQMLLAESYARRNIKDKQLDCLQQAFAISQEGPVLASYVEALLNAQQPDKVLEITKKVSESRMSSVVKAMRARAMILQKKSDAAETLFKEAMQSATPDELSTVLDQIEKGLGQKAALDKMESWMSLQPKNDWLVRARLASFYVRTDDPKHQERAVALLTEARSMMENPEQKAGIDVQLGSAYQQMGKMDLAEKAYKAALAVLPGNVDCLNNLAFLYTDANKPQDAKSYAEQAYKLMPNSSDVLDTYGWTLFKLGDKTKAETLLLQATQKDNVAPVCFYHMGLLYQQKKTTEDNDRARRMYKRAQDSITDKNDPLYKTVQQALDSLR